MTIYVNRENYTVLTISKYNAMKETMIAEAINDINEFEEWLDWNYNISKIFFFTDKEKNEIWEEWVYVKTEDIDEELESCWCLRELEV